jgi:pentatricopeptide repeat protein
MMKLLARLLESVSTGKIKAEASTLVALLSSVLDTQTFFFQRESAVLELLDMAEASLSFSDTGETSPVPRSLYTKVISLLVAKRDVKTIEKLFDRMKSKYAGAVDLLPDKNAYNMFKVQGRYYSSRTHECAIESNGLVERGSEGLVRL